MTKVKVTQIRSRSGATERQIANLVSLGIAMHHTVEVSLRLLQRYDEKVLHLVKVEEVK